MKKKGFTGRLAAVAAVLCLVTMSLTSGTLAKYASSVDGAAKATVAAWAIKFTDGGSTEYTSTKKIDLNLEDTQKVTDKLVADDKIAPETSGSFKLAVDGTDTEVAFDYAIEMDMSDTALANAPIKFYSDSTFATELTETAAGSKKYELKGTVKVGDTLKAEETVYWKWVTTDDATDTGLGEQSATATLTYTIPVTITATQKTA